VTKNTPGVTIHHERDIAVVSFYLIISDITTPDFIDTADYKTGEQIGETYHTTAIGCLWSEPAALLGQAVAATEPFEGVSAHAFRL
jgi:hypothetical protein